MAGIDLATATAKLQEYLDAETALNSKGQSYQFKDKSYTRADLAEVREGIKFWDAKVKELSTGRNGIRARGVRHFG